MNIVVLDFETFFSDDYSLRKMTVETYIRDPRFEVHGCGLFLQRDLVTGEGPPFTVWTDGPDLHGPFGLIDWAQTAVLCHNSIFDGMILFHHYGIKPAIWFDTLPMARRGRGNSVSSSLAALAKDYGLDAKNVPYDIFTGKHWHELTPDEQRLVADGCLHDCELTWTIFRRLVGDFSREELEAIDLTIKWAVEPPPLKHKDVGEYDLLYHGETAKGLKVSVMGSFEEFWLPKSQVRFVFKKDNYGQLVKSPEHLEVVTVTIPDWLVTEHKL